MIVSDVIWQVSHCTCMARVDVNHLISRVNSSNFNGLDHVENRRLVTILFSDRAWRVILVLWPFYRLVAVDFDAYIVVSHKASLLPSKLSLNPFEFPLESFFLDISVVPKPRFVKLNREGYSHLLANINLNLMSCTQGVLPSDTTPSGGLGCVPTIVR